MLPRHAEQIFEAAIVHAPRLSIEPQVISAAFTVAKRIANELVGASGRSIQGLQGKVNAYVDAMVDGRSVRAPASMQVDQLNHPIGATLPRSAAAIGPAKSEGSDRLSESAAQPLHAAFDNRRLRLLGVTHGA
jgi:hypothetical protein